MKSSRKKQQKRRQRKRDAAKTLNRRVRRRFPNQKVVMGEAQDGVKMSEALREFVAPYREFADTAEEYRRLLMIAIVAWNTALFPVQERKAYTEKMLQAIPEQDRADVRALIDELIVRKERYFLEYKRMIVDCEVTDTGDNYQLVVVSSHDEIGPS